MRPAQRKPDAQIGRYCAVCGHGMSYRRGGLDAAAPALRALGYDVPHDQQAYAHVKCLQSRRKK